jgi:hypothetical protein
MGDWIVGLSPKDAGSKIIYAMRVEEILRYDQYYQDCRFKLKVPDYTKRMVVYKCGDNIYNPLPDGDFRQLQSMHSDGPSEDRERKIHDLGGRNVLISRTFYYFGSTALDLPGRFQELRVGRAHKNHFSSGLVSAFIDFVRSQIPGVNAAPTSWPSKDDSWKTANQ